MERSVIGKALAFLNYRPEAKWTSIAAGIGTVIGYVLLVVLLGLFTDLLVYRGRIPTLAELSPQDQEQFQTAWKNLSEEERAKALSVLGFTDSDTADSVMIRERAALKSALLSTENLPPVPSKAKPEELQRWASEAKVTSEPSFVAAARNEVCWRAFVWSYLNARLGPDAANSYQLQINPNDSLPLPALGGEEDSPHGVLGTIIRLRGTWAGGVLGWIASWNSWMWNNRDSHPNDTYLVGLLVFGLLVACFRALCLVVMRLMAARATVEAVTRLRRAIYHHTIRIGNTLAFAEEETSDPQLLFTRHVEAINDTLYQWMVGAVRNPVQFGVLIIAAMLIHFWLTVVFLLFAIFIWLIGGQLTSSFRRQSRAAGRVVVRRQVVLLESLRLLRLVKAYLMEGFNQSRVERQLGDYARANLQRYRGEAFGRPFMLLLMTLGGVLMLYLAGRFVLGDKLGLAALAMLVASFSGLYLPVRYRLDFRRSLQRGKEAAAVIFEFLERKGDQAHYADAEFLQPMSRSLEFKDVTYREPVSGQVLLENISVVIRAGHRVAIICTDEAERRAFLLLLQRFLDPAEGEVRIDGRNLRWVTQESLRTQIGMVVQDHLIFNDTVANNIGCGDPGFNLPQLIEAAKLAHAHQFIHLLPYGYETPIGDLGHALRPGEMLRIAIARAVLRDPAIYIIEEPVAPLDEDTKALVDDTLDRILPGKTAIFLPHRLSTLRKCDQVIFISGGTIEATGTHKELLSRNELYQRWSHSAFGGFVESAGLSHSSPG